MGEIKHETAVLKKKMTDGDLYVMIGEKKTDFFRSTLRRPRRDDVHFESSLLNYECTTTVSGRYTADYSRDAKHAISVDRSVDEIVIGGETFPVRAKSMLRKQITGRLGKNRVDLPVTEHVSVENRGKIHLDPSGKETDFPFRVNSKTVENYPDTVLKENDSAVIASDMTDTDLALRLTAKLKPKLENDIRDLHEETIVERITRVYVPIYEIILFGPKKKTATMRIDASRCVLL